jgi:hypothetical protein
MIFRFRSPVRASFSFFKSYQFVLLAFVLGLSLVVPARAQNFYRVTDLGILRTGDASSAAYDVNDRGEVVGISAD